MKKYNIELITKYVNGDDLGNYLIEDLENNKIFMMQVIQYTNDEKIYNLCSDDLKNDYHFIKFLILKFKNNISFITKVADNFLRNNRTEYERLELTIMMAELTKGIPSLKRYSIMSNIMYHSKMLQIESYKLEKDDEEFSNEIGMGFILIYHIYSDSDIILKYYAKKIIDYIFEENDIDIEKILHRQFKTPEEIDNQGLNNYMLNFIERYDSMLASYASINLDVLMAFKKKIIKAKNNWKTYNDRLEREKYKCMFEKVHDYMEDVETLFSETYLIYYIGKELEVLEKIKQYDYISEELLEPIIKEIYEEDIEKIFELNFIDRIHYINIKNIITNTLFGTKRSLINKPDNQKRGKCKILELNFNKK